MKEYSRTPEEIATDFPTDPRTRAKIEDQKEQEFMNKQKLGLREALNSEFEDEKETISIFDVYMNGKYTADSKLGQQKLASRRKDIYNEYKELNEKYGAQVAEMLKSKVNMKHWKDIPGDDWVPDEEDTGAAGEENISSTSAENSIGDKSEENSDE